MSDVPVWLTNPAEALGEREVWERRFERRILAVLRATATTAVTTTMTAAATKTRPPWARTAKEILGVIPDLPPAQRRLVLSMQVAEDVSNVTLAQELARNLATPVYNVHVLKTLALHGFALKQWVTRHDARVRPAHRAIDGTKALLSRPFRMEGYQLQYPGDSTMAPPDLTQGCRCILIGKNP